MKAALNVVIPVLFTVVLSAPSAPAADDSKLKDATGQVESGAKAAGEGIKDTARGVGHTVSEGAKVAGDRLREAGREAEPDARSAWDHVKAGASSFGHSVKRFFTRLGQKD
jgi:hypothetical protein